MLTTYRATVTLQMFDEYQTRRKKLSVILILLMLVFLVIFWYTFIFFYYVEIFMFDILFQFLKYYRSCYYLGLYTLFIIRVKTSTRVIRAEHRKDNFLHIYVLACSLLYLMEPPSCSRSFP